MRRLNRLVAVTAAIGLAATIIPSWSSAAVGQAARLRLVDLGTLGGPSSQARAINDLGHIVGVSTIDDAGGTSHAFLWRDGRMIDLGTLGGQFSEALDINNRDEIVGYSTTSGGEAHAFVWRDGRMHDLGNFMARAINDWGTIVGDGWSLDGQRALQWRAGQLSVLSLPPGAQASAANDINNWGEIVGWSAGDGTITALRWRDGQPMPLGANENVTAINDRGWMTAGPFNSLDSAWLRLGRRITPIDRPAGSSVIQANGLNDFGVVVGFTDLGAFLWEQGRLNVLPSVAGERTIADDLNNVGQIAGFRAITPEGAYTHAVLWTRS